MEKIRAMTTAFAFASAANFNRTVRLLGTLPSSRMKRRGDSLFVSTGVAIPDQNYVYGSTSGDPTKLILQALEFFREENVPFTWWLPPASRKELLRRALEEHGLPERCSPPSMGLDLNNRRTLCSLPPLHAVRIVRTPSEAYVWAGCSLKGFDSGSEHEEKFSSFAAALAAPPFNRSFRLLTLYVDGNPAATALLSLAERIAGIYYFSTLPAFRRRGLGLLLLDKTLEEAGRSGCDTVTLQASPMGFPLYSSAGFVECGRFSVHSADPDAC